MNKVFLSRRHSDICESCFQNKASRQGGRLSPTSCIDSFKVIRLLREASFLWSVKRQFLKINTNILTGGILKIADRIMHPLKLQWPSQFNPPCRTHHAPLRDTKLCFSKHQKTNKTSTVMQNWFLVFQSFIQVLMRRAVLSDSCLCWKQMYRRVWRNKARRGRARLPGTQILQPRLRELCDPLWEMEVLCYSFSLSSSVLSSCFLFLINYTCQNNN